MVSGPVLSHSPAAIRGIGGSVDVQSAVAAIIAPASHVTEVRNGANAQAVRVYNTFTDTGNYERATLNWTANVLTLTTAALGTGDTSRSIAIRPAGAGTLFLGTDGANNWQVTPTTHEFAPVTTNSVDLGATAQRVRTVYAGTSLNISGTTITASAPILNLAQTWNNAGVTFTGILANFTSTASAAASLLMDLQVGGASQFSFSKAGQLLASGVASDVVGTYAFQGHTDYGISYSTGPSLTFITGGAARFRIDNNGNLVFLGGAITSPATVGGIIPVTITHGADTAVVASKPTLVITAHTMAITGAIATFLDVVFNTMTISGAFTVTQAIGTQINGPVPTTATFTNSVALDLPTYVTNGTTASGLRVVAPSGAATNWAILATGRGQFSDKVYFGTDAAAAQVASGLYAGTGAPNNANGADGDFYHRADGGALTTIYHRRAGVWVGVV